MRRTLSARCARAPLASNAATGAAASHASNVLRRLIGSRDSSLRLQDHHEIAPLANKNAC
jgi:hypothetical protein